MDGVGFGDVVFILLVCGLIWGIVTLTSRTRRTKVAGGGDASAPASEGDAEPGGEPGRKEY